MTGNLSWIDYLILAGYLAGILGLGLAVGRRITTGKDYFLAGRRLPWWIIGTSLVATDIGGTDIIGVGGAAYSYGMAVGNFEWIGCIPAMIVAAFVFIPFFWRAGVYTIPEFMEKRFNAGVRSSLAFCWLVFMACNIGVMLFASAKMAIHAFGLDVSEGFLHGRESELCILVMAVIVGIYTLAGGLTAVVYTDVIQCLVMIGGCLIIVVMGVGELGGISGLFAKVQAVEQAQGGQIGNTGQICEHTALILPVDTRTPFPWTGIFFGLALILSPAYWIGNQAIVQRSFGARSEFEAKAAYIWGALLKNLIPVVIAVPGLIAFAKFPDLVDGDNAFPVLVSTMLPIGLKGLFLAAFVAALMSSVDSYLNSAATILTNDLYKRFIHPQADERRLLFIGRLTTVILIIWAVGFAIYISKIEGSGIYNIFQTLMAFFQGPALAMLLAGLLWPRANGMGALVGFVGGILTCISLFTLSQQSVCRLLNLEPLFKIESPFLYFSIWGFLVAMVLIIVVSLSTRPEPDDKIRHFVYRRGSPIK
ncbi:MAG: sodium/solute symporter [Planctomycetota bacterium]|nr:MAG: sodium/solute symporter [Planctomycetota bacterium]